MHRNPRLPELYSQYLRKVDIQTRIRGLRKKIQATKDILQLEELTKCRKCVLCRLAFISSNDDIVEMKGRVACEISSGDELLLTELIFNGGFNSLTPEQCAAGLLSCFVFTEKVRFQKIYTIVDYYPLTTLCFCYKPRVNRLRRSRRSWLFPCVRCNSMQDG